MIGLCAGCSPPHLPEVYQLHATYAVEKLVHLAPHGSALLLLHTPAHAPAPASSSGSSPDIRGSWRAEHARCSAWPTGYLL